MSVPVYAFDNAIVRRPASSVVNGLRAVDQGEPSLAGVEAEHSAYIQALEAAGVAVEVLPPLEAFPDSIFVEDPALVFPEGAVVLRPGAESRLGEAAEIAPVLRRRFERVLDLEAGYADGGDVLTTPDRILIGLSARTDQTGAEALVAALGRLGRKAEIVATPAGVLHFKSDCSLIDGDTVLSTARLAESGVFDRLGVLIVPEGEEAAANALRVNDVVLVGANYPRTADMLARHGYTVVPLSVIEIAKIDAGLSCMSLRWHSA
ncbi:dimethylarginine dimethylaminohydrolase family protein [Segnochrobactrum spirostomi]|uniref:Dimethylarginine dimethylaminohydrolase n=1 Tax=Segnochrobactrum spirostomi TaxID=2608987 RepID=A0A6A7XYD7_9HYPH|nr:dimethylarginine dimethylaminohydrolase [Segnochrobactrum spirostomi]MQT11475.1 dimethylarginine dimethylaminohydrolase [Segnochrobactrum spirostomi]